MPFIYIVQRRNFPEPESDESEAFLKILGLYTNEAAANKAAKAAANSIYEDADQSLAEPPQEATRGSLYAAEIFVFEDSPGSHMVFVEVVKHFAMDNYVAEEDEDDSEEDDDDEDEDGDGDEDENDEAEDVMAPPAKRARV